MPAIARGRTPYAPTAAVPLTKERRAALTTNAGTVAAYSLAASYAVLITVLAVAQHATFHTRARDMGIYAQVLWNTGHGRPFASTLLADNTLHIAEHVAPVLAVLTPIYALAPDPRWLLALQQMCLAAAGLPLYFWARGRLGDLPALALQAAYYAMPAMSRVALSEFHPIVMAALPMSLGVKATLEGQLRPAVVWLLIALLFEEETAGLVIATGAYLMLRHRRRAGLALAALGSAWLLTTVLLVMPSFQAGQSGRSAVGNRALGHYDTFRENPAVTLEWLGGGRGAEAASWLLAPSAGLPLLAPSVFALAVPTFAFLFIQDRESTFAGHWSAAMLPVVWFAAAAGLTRLVSWAGARRRTALHVATIAIIVASGVSYARFSLFPGGRGFDEDRFVWTEHEEKLARAVALVPPNARLDATRRAVPHLANRPEAYQFPSTFYSAPMRPDLGRIDVFLLDLTDSPTRRALDPTDQDTVLSKRPRMHTRVFGEHLLLLTRERPVPSRATEASFGNSLRLNGYDLERLPSSGGLRLTPHWEAIARAPDATRVVELVSADGRSVARAEAIPLAEYLPPARWDRGQIVVDSVDLRVPTVPPGDYRPTISWRNADGNPIPLADGGERLELETVRLP